MSKLWIMYKKDGKVVTDTIEDPDWWQALMNVQQFAVDGKVYTDVIEIEVDNE